MDEPAAGLDPAGRVEFRRLLASLRDQGKAIIVSSHILADLAEYCTHIAIMGHGRLVQQGTVGEVAGGGHERGLYRVVLSRPMGDLRGRLDAIAGLTRVDADGAIITFEFDRDRVAAAGLLAQLLGVGLPVAEFRPLEANLEEAYLRTGIRQVD
jgi:ABC-2 type transport system ATP-binding protein